MSNVYVDPTAIIDEKVELGNYTKIWHFVHIMENAKIGNNCVISDYVYLGRGVSIGSGVKIENRASLFEGVSIEDDVFVGPHVTFTNDLYPKSLSPKWKVIRTIVKKGSSIGAGSVIVCGVTIGDYALIGAGSVVTNNIPPNALAYGNPARVRGFVCNCRKKLQIQERTEKNVLMTCLSCKKKYSIPSDDYGEIINE